MLQRMSRLLAHSLGPSRHLLRRSDMSGVEVNVLQKSPIEQPIINIGQELNRKERIFESIFRIGG
jgi:hypothetical protein